MNTKQKIVSIRQLQKIVAELKERDKKIVATNGAFDLLHIGQKRCLEESKLLGDILIVGINSDSSVKQSKSDLRPIIHEDERAELVAALACVDYVTIFNEKDPVNFLELIHPNIYTKGGDYTLEQNLEADFVRKNVGKIIIIPGKIQSTTDIIKKIIEIYSSKNSQKK